MQTLKSFLLLGVLAIAAAWPHSVFAAWIEVEVVGSNGPDGVILDLTYPDSQGNKIEWSARGEGTFPGTTTYTEDQNNFYWSGGFRMCNQAGSSQPICGQNPIFLSQPSPQPGPGINWFAWQDNNGNDFFFQYSFDGTNYAAAGPPPPTTQFNEVTQYIPAAGVSTTTGVMTVGAEFSIAQPTYVAYIGYRLFDPTNTVVFNATSSVPVAGIYTLYTDYDFDMVGQYTGHAYWAQDVGGNIWETDNPTIQNVLIDVPQWSVNPDGSFTGNPATTSTTTLSNLNLDCGTGFAGSICNLVARIFIPSNASIAGLQSSFNNLLLKAPFSFFTESHDVLESFWYDGNSYGGTLSLELYGSDVDILSASSSAAIGFSSTELDFFKSIVNAALYFFLAWYLYWRIASIFGV